MTLNDADTGLRPDEAAPPEPVRPPTPGGISMRPAMIVLGLAVVILVAFVAIGILSSHSPAPVTRSSGPSAVPGVTLPAVSAAHLLSPIVRSGEPPTNILNAVSVPVGSVRLSHRDNSGQAAQFDSQVVFSSDDTQGALLAFFAADMKLQGWQVFDRGPAANNPGALEVLGKLAGSDGYYWEMGAVIPPTRFSAGGPAHGQTDYTVRLFQVNDAA
jgi:hypothetical protein